MFRFQDIQIKSVSLFANVATGIGVFLGFFQYYVQREEEKVREKLITTLNRLINLKKFSFKEFKNFLSEKGSNNILKEIKHTPEEIDRELRNLLMQKRYEQRGRDLHLYVFYNLLMDSMIFELIENKFREKKEEEKLLKEYEKFFQEKKKEILKDIEREKFILENISQGLFSVITFFEEALIESLTLQQPTEKPKSYNDFLSNTLYEIVEKIINFIVLGEPI